MQGGLAVGLASSWPRTLGWQLPPTKQTFTLTAYNVGRGWVGEDSAMQSARRIRGRPGNQQLVQLIDAFAVS